MQITVLLYMLLTVEKFRFFNRSQFLLGFGRLLHWLFIVIAIRMKYKVLLSPKDAYKLKSVKDAFVHKGECV